MAETEAGNAVSQYNLGLCYANGNGVKVDLAAQHSGEDFQDESDRVFFEIALAGEPLATKFVTGNHRHYPQNPIVVTPAQMVALLEGENFG